MEKGADAEGQLAFGGDVTILLNSNDIVMES
jgi:hypothetical protein